MQGVVTPVHQQMVAAAMGKNIWIAGGGELADQFFDAGLLDELIIQVASVTLGQGLPLLPRLIAFPSLRLTSAQALGEAFAELHYEVPHPGEGSGIPAGVGNTSTCSAIIATGGPTPSS